MVWCSPGYDYSTCKIYPVLPENGMCCFSVYLAKRTAATRAVLPNVCSVLVLPWVRLLKHQQELPSPACVSCDDLLFTWVRLLQHQQELCMSNDDLVFTWVRLLQHLQELCMSNDDLVFTWERLQQPYLCMRCSSIYLGKATAVLPVYVVF